MKRIGDVLVLCLFLACCSALVSANDLSVTPYGIDVRWNISDSQPSDVTLTFVNHDNESFDLDLSLEGEVASFFSLSKYNLSFTGSSMDTTKVIFSIDGTKGAGLFFGKINFGDNYVPVYVTVKQKEEVKTGCKIISTSSEYVYYKKKGTEPTKEDFYFKISKDCTGGIDITDIKLNGGIDTEQGKQPIRLYGGIPKGSYNPGDSFIVSLEFDVSELTPQTYEENLFIAGLTGDESVKNEVKFKFNVLGQKASVLGINDINPPLFDPIPNKMVVNQSYAIVARQVNPNLNIIFVPNEFISGEAPTLDSDTWVYRFTPIKEGETQIKVYAEYKGGVVGTPLVQDVKIMSDASVIGTVLKIRFLKDVNSLQDGDELAFMIVTVENSDTDPSEGIILREDLYTVYVNGQAISENKFVVYAGEEYLVSVSVPNFKTVEQTFTVQQKILSLSIIPDNPKVNDTVTVNTEENATIKFNGAALEGNTFIIENEGEYYLTVEKEGFQSNSLNFTAKIEIPPALVSGPESVSIGETLHYVFNQPIKWVLEWSAEKNDIPKTANSGEGETLDVIIEDEGYWAIRDSTTGMVIWSGEVTESFFQKHNWFIWVAILGGIGIIIIYSYRGKIKGISFGRKPKEPKIGYEFNPS